MTNARMTTPNSSNKIDIQICSQLTNRLPFLDITKGVAIFLVTFSHCIHYGNGFEFLQNQAFFDNTFTRLICSFHMPLFIMVSGFLFFSSCNNHAPFALITKKGATLVLPSETFSFFFFVSILTTVGFSKSCEFNIVLTKKIRFTLFWEVYGFYGRFCIVFFLR